MERRILTAQLDDHGFIQGRESYAQSVQLPLYRACREMRESQEIALEAGIGGGKDDVGIGPWREKQLADPQSIPILAAPLASSAN